MKNIVLFFVGFCSAIPAFAGDGGLFVEPMVTLSREDGKLKTSTIPGFDDTSGTIDSYGVGAKLGMHVSDIVFLGVDGRFTRSKINDTSYGSATGNSYNFGPTVGVQMPIVGLRVFGTYVPFGVFDPEAGSQGIDVKAKKGQGFRVGAGFRVAVVSLNLEYQDIKYDETELQSAGAFVPTGVTDFDYETKGWIASVSFPIAL